MQSVVQQGGYHQVLPSHLCAMEPAPLGRVGGKGKMQYMSLCLCCLTSQALWCKSSSKCKLETDMVLRYFKFIYKSIFVYMYE